MKYGVPGQDRIVIISWLSAKRFMLLLVDNKKKTSVKPSLEKHNAKWYIVIKGSGNTPDSSIELKESPKLSRSGRFFIYLSFFVIEKTSSMTLTIRMPKVKTSIVLIGLPPDHILSGVSPLPFDNIIIVTYFMQ